MKTFIALSLSLLVAGTITAQPETEDNTQKKQLSRMMQRTDVGTYTMKYFADVAKYTFSQTTPGDKWESKYQEAIRNANTNADKLSADFQKIISRNQQNVEKERIIFKTAEYTGRVFMSPIESLPIWGPIQKEINNQVFQLAEDELNNTYKKKLALSLQQIRTDNIDKYNNIIRSGNYNEVKNALDEVHFFSNTAFDDMDPAFREIVEKSQQKFLQESVKNTLERVVTDLGTQQMQIGEIDQKISKLSQFTYRFAEESNRRFDGLVQAQAQLNDKVDAFYDQYKTDKKALDFMQGFLYNKMNTKEKIEALNAGMLSNIPENERQKLAAELVLERKKEEVIEKAGKYLNSAAISLKILGDLGMGDSKLVQDISTAVNIGQTAVAAVTAFTSGNYLGAVSNITGLFGKKGDDVASQRHKQVMQRFDRIDATLTRIEGKMDQLMRSQQEMLRLQMETFEHLVQLSDKIDEQHNQVMQRLTEIEQALYENRQIIMNDWNGKCQACLQTMERLELNVDEGRLPDWEKLNAEYTNIKEGEFRRCEEYIKTYVFYFDRPSFNPDFNLTAHIDGVDIAKAYRKLDTINRLSFNLLFSYNKPVGKLRTSRNLLYSLFFPSTSMTELNQKIQADSISFSSEYYPVIPNLFSSVIKPEVSERHGYVVRNIGFLQSLTDANRNLVTWDEFTEKRPPRHRDARYELKNAIRLNNVAIAQQAILAGDILLPVIFNEVYQYQSGSGDTAMFKVCASLLQLNELMAGNFVHYFTGTYLKKAKQTELQYGYAFNTKDSLAMSQVIKSVFPVSYLKTGDARLAYKNRNEGWYMRIGTAFYPLPHPAEVNKIPLVQSQYLGGLLRNREKLLQQIFSYSAYDKNTAESLNYMIMKN